MLFFDEDSDARFYQFEAGTMCAGDLDAMLENLGNTKVGTYILGVNAQMANFRNSTVQCYLDNFDIRLGTDQPALRQNHSHWAYRRRANMAVLEAHGIDSNEYLLNGARRLGMAAWIDVRMNDIHDGHDEDSQIHSDLWREHPELRIPGNIPCENGFDYSQEAVRKMYADFIVEAFTKYHPDNVLLDWMRWPTHFPRETGPVRAHLITEMLIDIRDRIGQPFACRVPITPESALKIGLDIAGWVKAGVLSHLFLGNYGSAPGYDVPIERWRQEIVGAMPIVVTLEESWGYGIKNPHGDFSVEEARGLAAANYWRGADGIQIFNCMKMLRPLLSSDLFRKAAHNEQQQAFLDKGRITFNEIHDPELLYTLPRRVHPGWDDTEMCIGDLDQIFRIPGYFENWKLTHEFPRNTLPQSKPYTWHLWTAKAPDHDAVLTTDAPGKILVNGHVTQGPAPITIPREWLKDGVTEIKTNGLVTRMYIDL